MTYRRFSEYLRQAFGTKVYKVPLDGGFTCPNRDGTKAIGGCTFCKNESFRPDYVSPEDDLETQFQKGRTLFRRKNAELFLGYFQTNTNTYAPVKELERKYRTVLRHDDVVGLCIGTRPDCVGAEVVERLVEIASEGHEVWVELGLQSAHDKTLDRVNRCHTFRDYREAAERIRSAANLNLCTHLMFGLPGETTSEMMDTVRRVSEGGLAGVKFHQLQVIEGTKMARQFRETPFRTLDYETYRDLITRSLETLPDDVIVHRLMADAADEELIAPRWERDKHQLARDVESRLGGE